MSYQCNRCGTGSGCSCDNNKYQTNNNQYQTNASQEEDDWMKKYRRRNADYQ